MWDWRLAWELNVVLQYGCKSAALNNSSGVVEVPFDKRFVRKTRYQKDHSVPLETQNFQERVVREEL